HLVVFDPNDLQLPQSERGQDAEPARTAAEADGAAVTDRLARSPSVQRLEFDSEDDDEDRESEPDDPRANDLLAAYPQVNGNGGDLAPSDEDEDQDREDDLTSANVAGHRALSLPEQATIPAPQLVQAELADQRAVQAWVQHLVQDVEPRT